MCTFIHKFSSQVKCSSFAHLRVVEVYNAADSGVPGPLQNNHIALAQYVLVHV